MNGSDAATATAICWEQHLSASAFGLNKLDTTAPQAYLQSKPEMLQPVAQENDVQAAPALPGQEHGRMRC